MRVLALHKRNLAQVAAGFLVLWAAGSAAAQCHYTYITVPNPPGQFVQCRATCINNHGHVAGIIVSLSDDYRSFIWTPEGRREDLPMPPGVWNLVAKDINDLGDVCGFMHGPAGEVGFVWDGEEYIIINRPAWANGIQPNSINNGGQIVGTVYNNLTGPLHAFVWHAGTFVDLGPSLSDTDSYGADTNEMGRVSGSARGAIPTQWRSFVAAGLSIDWLEHPSPLDRSDVIAMSNNGFFAGEGRTEDPLHFYGIVWTPWGVTVLAPPAEFRDARLRDVNDAGRAIGVYDRRVGGSAVPIVWQNGQATDLTTLVRPSAPPGLIAGAINSAGQIAATHNGGTVILNPVWLSGDLTGDCHVGIEDLVLVLSNFGAPYGTFPLGDVNVDGEVDLADLAIVLGHWGE